MFTKDTIISLKKEIKPDTINSFIAKHKTDSPLVGIGGFLVDVCDGLGINPIFMLARIILESYWGLSSIAKDKNNVLGWGAVNADPYNGAWRFNTVEGCIAVVCHKIRKHYIDKGFDTVEEVMDKYSTADDTQSTVKLMNQIEIFRVEQEKNLKP